MKLYLARHAQTIYNVARLINSDPSVNVHLTELGLIQARALAEDLKDKNINIIFASEFPRTQQTARIINVHHDKKIIIDKRINENNTGFNGQPAKVWYDAIDASDDSWNVRFNDGESRAELFARAQEFIEDLKRSSYDSALVVTHGALTEMFYGIIEQKSREEMLAYVLPQGTFTEFEV